MQAQKFPVLKRLVPACRKRVARLFWPNGRGIVRRDGVLYLLNLESNNWVDKDILLWGGLDPNQRAFLFENVRQRGCDTFLDIGANFGIYALCAGLQTSCSTIIAFEPDPRAYDRLRTHLLINGLTEKVETRMLAISDHNGTVPFIPGHGSNDSSSKVGTEGNTDYSVPSARLDDLLPVSGRRIALRIDVEGHEMAALAGMKSLLRNNDCFLQIECWSQNAEPFIAAMKAETYECLHHINDDHYFARMKS